MTNFSMTKPSMTKLRALLAGFLVVTLAFGASACGDDPGEDEIGDGEINDEGD